MRSWTASRLAGAVGSGCAKLLRTSQRSGTRAFAAEFLLPEQGMQQLSGGVLDGLPDETDLSLLLEDYGVGARTAAYQLWNRGWLSSSTLRDELIDRFAASDFGAPR